MALTTVESGAPAQPLATKSPGDVSLPFKLDPIPELDDIAAGDTEETERAVAFPEAMSPCVSGLAGGSGWDFLTITVFSLLGANFFFSVVAAWVNALRELVKAYNNAKRIELFIYGIMR